jgi:hypothetical protein
MRRLLGDLRRTQGDLLGRLERALAEADKARGDSAEGELTRANDLTGLVNGAAEVGPATGNLDAGFVDEPPIPDHVPRRPGGGDELRCKGLHPPVDGDMIDVNAPLSQQLLDPDRRASTQQRRRSRSGLA